MVDAPGKKYTDIARKVYILRLKPFLKSKEFKRALFISGAFLSGCIFLVLLLDIIIMPIYLRTGEEIRVPNLTNMSFQDAKNIAYKSHLGIVTDAVDYHDSISVNNIAFQIPVPGAVVKPGRRIHVVISKGPPPPLMPNVTGKSPRNADLLLREAGLKVSSRKFQSSKKYPPGVVIDQFPKPQMEIGDKSGIILYISN
jgi:eukaryotic-like serine/threonine-protein kinase